MRWLTDFLSPKAPPVKRAKRSGFSRSKRKFGAAAKATLELREDQCRFPIGDPKTADFRYCCCAKALGSVYCNYHKNRCEVPLRQ